MVGPSFGGEDEETMTGADLRVEVRDQDIIVTMPETSFRVVYRKPNHRGAQLAARLDYFKHDQKGPITRAQTGIVPNPSMVSLGPLGGGHRSGFTSWLPIRAATRPCAHSTR